MPYLCEIEITGPRTDDEGTVVAQAVLAAVEEGWRSPRIDREVEAETEAEDADTVLDYRVLGYPGGAFVVVVLPDVGLEAASLAAASLARHVVTWSPGLLEYSVGKLKVVPLDEPYDAENWLPPFDDDGELSHRPPPELLGDELRSLSARYLLVSALPSLWDPAAPEGGVDAAEVVAGADEAPWDRDLVDELGILLVRAARFEAAKGATSRLVVRGSGDLELAASLLRRARGAVAGEEPGWHDDQVRGHELLSYFTADHGLAWRHPEAGEPEPDYRRRRTDRLRELLWAGLRTLATLAAPLAEVKGTWRVLDALGDDEIVATYAEWETGQLEVSVEHDDEEIYAASTALALVWTAIRRPELLSEMSETEDFRDVFVIDPTPFHFFTCSALIMAGAQPTVAAVETVDLPPELRRSLLEFAAALAETERDGGEREDPYDDMNDALEAVITAEDDRSGPILAVLEVIGRAAALIPTDVGVRGPGAVLAPRHLAAELVAHPSMHGTVLLDDDTWGDDTIRLHTLAFVAAMDAVAAGELAADFPDLTGADPRMEPAARERARNWVGTALRLAEVDGEVAFTTSDARVYTERVREEGALPSWPVRRCVAAAATAAADLLRAAGREEELPEVFVTA
ncbi:hypothetical protein [Phytomonospora endophytica]|uniref:Uncharacterized protein n=1 Tax=Phytomonospora endophytica TaxID=714109 RepID=A0A841FGY2_9ACTN|nr:hypothetical protein [Phytomonospora endophytica]MBB6034955.1 hypothetical protein [Phytomonospora endophytica]GIG70657.1 hypothetical protein Pen01_69520 [Phytomonospora endophytica]